MAELTRKGGLGHCVHHDRHYEVCYDFQERADFIRKKKALGGQEARLANFWLFPALDLPQDLVAAWEEANAARDKAYVAWDKAYVARDKAYAAWVKAIAEADKVLLRHLPEIESLHDRLIAEGYTCTWNGQSIFQAG